MKRRTLLACSALLLPTLLAACGSQTVRNQPPLAQVSGWTIAGEQLRVDLHLRNVNGEPMPLLGVTVDLRLDDAPLAHHAQALDSSIAASGFETVSLLVTPGADGLAALASLQDGERRSLTYAMEGHVVTDGGKQLRFERDGHVYPVPGRPGQFR